MTRNIRIVTVVILAIAIILSCTVVGRKLTDPATYSHTIEVLDENRSSVLALSAASAAASAALSALPNDICTPLAEELSQFSTYFILILSVVYLGKFLLTVMGSAACYLLIPAGLAALIIHQYFPSGTLKNLGLKFIAFGIALLLIIPTSVWVQDKINMIYEKSIEATVESANAASSALLEDAEGDSKEKASIIDRAKAVLDDTGNSISGVVGQFKTLINRFVEATAVMIVTNCIIPIAVMLLFIWLVKTLFGVQMMPPVVTPRRPGRGRREHAGQEQ